MMASLPTPHAAPACYASSACWPRGPRRPPAPPPARPQLRPSAPPPRLAARLRPLPRHPHAPPHAPRAAQSPGRPRPPTCVASRAARICSLHAPTAVVMVAAGSFPHCSGRKKMRGSKE
ncbi:hypothetical protein BRADI_3g43677v3 [Brachypodium distachyon]|uniref:Uncharacterized protein n=1 Tax=Brachypodium distachyon TaxID=15368 RepID=A0A2K2D2Y5_BRADI|nr:hypothetical protein BRADI_3g43677v3 [Brachypodium distachyon]